MASVLGVVAVSPWSLFRERIGVKSSDGFLLSAEPSESSQSSGCGRMVRPARCCSFADSQVQPGGLTLLRGEPGAAQRCGKVLLGRSLPSGPACHWSWGPGRAGAQRPPRPPSTGTPWRYCGSGPRSPQERQYHRKGSQVTFLASQCGREFCLHYTSAC